LVNRFHEETNPEAFHKASWTIVGNPYLNSFQYGFAVRQAQAACAGTGDEKQYLITLGLAHYRAGDWKEAVAVLEKSMRFRQGGDGLEWFFLAMAHWRLCRQEEAREWYDRAVRWMDKDAPQNEAMRRFRAETEALLGVKGKKD